MNNIEDKYYASLDIDKETMSSAGAKSVVVPTFQATFTPPHPLLGTYYSANTFIYASLTERSISVIGRYEAAGVFEQISIVFPRDIEDGKHPVVPQEQNGVHITDIMNGEFNHATKGEITIKRNSEKKIFEAIFDVETKNNGTIYKITHGIVILEATGPL
ncbi:hypothetical protein D3C78_1127830 [compost metagenome]